MDFSANPDILILKIKELCGSRCYRSAEIIVASSLASLSLSDTKLETVFYRSQLYDILGDIYSERNEISQSCEYFRLSLNAFEKNQIYIGGNKIISTFLMEVRYKLALILHKSNQNKLAIQTLEIIPISNRQVKVNMVLGRLYQNEGLVRQAILVYKSVLAVNPAIVEAIEYLSQLGANLEDVLKVVKPSKSDADISKSGDNELFAAGEEMIFTFSKLPFNSFKLYIQASIVLSFQ